MKVLNDYYIPKHARLKAWKWCLEHLPADYVKEHGRKLLVVARNGMDGSRVRDDYRARFKPQFRGWFHVGDYGVRWERTF